MAEVVLLALAPVGFWLAGDRDRVAAGHDDPRYPLTELILDYAVGGLAVV